MKFNKYKYIRRTKTVHSKIKIKKMNSHNSILIFAYGRISVEFSPFKWKYYFPKNTLKHLEIYNVFKHIRK